MAGWNLGERPLMWLSQSSIPHAIPLSITASVFVPKANVPSAHYLNLRYSPISPQLTALSAGLTLGSFLYEASDYRRHSVMGKGGFPASSDRGIFRYQGVDSTVRRHSNPTASRTSFAALDSRRSSLRSSCPADGCTANGHNRPLASLSNRSRGGERNAGGSGSGGGRGGQHPAEVVKMFTDGTVSLGYTTWAGKAYEEPPPPPPPPPPPTIDDDDGGDPHSGSAMFLALLAFAAVCGLLTGITIKRRRIRHVRPSVPITKSDSQKPSHAFDVPNTALLTNPLDGGPERPCMLEDCMVDYSDSDPICNSIVVEQGSCPPGYTEVRFKDFEVHQELGLELDSNPTRPLSPPILDWRNFLRALTVSQLKFLKFALVCLSVMVGTLLNLVFIVTIYQSYRAGEKYDEICDEPPVEHCTDIKEVQRSEDRPGVDTLDGPTTAEDQILVEIFADKSAQDFLDIAPPNVHIGSDTQTEPEFPAGSTSLTLVHSVVPVVEKRERWLDFDESGYPFFGSTVKFDPLGIHAPDLLYEEDISFNLDEALEDLKIHFAEGFRSLSHNIIDTVETEAEVSVSVSSNNICGIHGGEVSMSNRNIDDNRDEEVTPVNLEHQLEMYKYRLTPSLSIDDIYEPLQGLLCKDYSPHSAEPVSAEIVVATIGFDAHVGEAPVPRDTPPVETDDELSMEGIAETQGDRLCSPTPDLHSLNPRAKSFVPGLFPFEGLNSLESALIPDSGNDEKGYRRRRKRPNKRN